MAKIGIMGGTFDPIHNGHLMLGRQAYTEYDLDVIWFMPSGQPPHKKDRSVSCSAHRCAMVNLAIQTESAFRFSDFEVSRDGSTYTAQTMKRLKEVYPNHQFYYIIGADSLYEIEQWYHPAEVLSSVIFLTADREYRKEHRSLADQIDYLTKRYHARIHLLHCQEMDLSSDEIRQAVRSGLPISEHVPQSVREYIDLHHLYAD